MPKKIIIIGAGVVGAAIAFYLSKKGAKVTVLEKKHIAAEASGSSFGWLNANFPESSDYFNLRKASLDEYPNLLRKLPENMQTQFNGCLFWELQGEALTKHYQGLKSFDYPVNLIDSMEFQKLEPNMTALPALAMKAETEGAVDAEKLTRTLLQHADVELIESCETLDFLQNENQITGVKTNQGDLFADVTVIAAGISAGDLLARINIDLPMNNRKGFIIQTRPVKPIIRHVLFGPEIHFKQQGDGTVVIGDWLYDVEGDVDLEKISLRTMQRFAQYFPKQDKIEIDKITAAYRPMPEDGYSVIGQPENKTGVYIASTHSGVTLAPIIGKFATQEILAGEKSDLLKSFRIERFDN